MSESTHQCGGCGGCGSGQEPQPEPKLAPHSLSQIKTVIGIAGGKGGTGKSLVSGLLAAELQKRGKQVGVLDADILAPAVAEMFHLPQGLTQGGEGLYPALSEGGVKVVSVSLLLESATEPVTWHSPVMATILQQLWSRVIWDQLDCLIIDLPPGTGDVTLAAFERLPLDGIIAVSTPQLAATRALERTLLLAEEKQVPVLGLVENFASLFRGSALEELAKLYQLPIFDRLLFDPVLADAADGGQIESLETSYLPNTVTQIAEM